jgi:hypothetical protein
MMRRDRRLPTVTLSGAALILLVGLASCASAPGKTVPSWVLSVPEADASTTWFTGSASIAGRDLAKADEAATADLVASIMRYIGAKVTVESTATAKATVDSYQTDIIQSVKTSADNRVAGFSIKDRYIAWDPQLGRSTVYILAAYRTADLEGEKKRIAAAFAEKADAVAIPEAQGDAFAAQGRDWDALGSYVSAAVAASGSSITNADIKLRRNLDKALSAIATIRVSVIPPSGKAYVGSPWPGAFAIRVENGGSGLGVPGAALLVSYPRKQGPRVGQRTVTAVTDAAGSASFLPPPPDFVGQGKLTVSVDFSAWANQLDGLPAQWNASTDALRQAFSAARSEIGVMVSSRAASYPIAVAIVDEGQDGGPLADANASSALIDTLSRSGFSVSSIALDPGLLAGGNEAAIRQAATSLGTTASRLAYGEARVLSSRQDGATWIVTARINAKVVDMASGSLLWSGERQATGLGNDETSAIRSALRTAGGTTLGGELLSSLP